ncbi:MAG TPA: DNA recombination protein RmuC [Gallionella sp.]|nr:DNA recombination protein RmuC [Gallionella sp.]
MKPILMEQLIYFIASLFIGLLVGAAAVGLVLRARISSAGVQAKGESQVEIARLNERLTASQEDNERLEMEKENLAALRDQLMAAQQRLSNQVAELTTTLESERTRNAEKIELLKNAEEQLSNRFKTLASEILEDKTRRFTEQNQTNLNQLLEPLKVKITEFQGKVQEVYVQEGKDRSALAEQVKQLVALNNQLSKDAHNLTSALKGQAKAQGTWGERILEQVLEASGLRKGHEYEVQESHTREDGSRAQPDVVVHLPEDRHLIVDAKVSLKAYEEHANAETDHQRDAALKRHLDSVRAHIKGLSEKNYQQLYGLQSLDFVLMFIPLEPAFMLAISHDSDLWQDAWNKNVLLVSPSTLLFVVRTVAHLWRQEQQNRNAQEIASRGAELYDKLAGFVEDLDKLGDRLNQAKDVYDKAYGKFTAGRGNVIRQAEMLKELGVKPTKQLPQKLIDPALDEHPSLPSDDSLQSTSQLNE